MGEQCAMLAHRLLVSLPSKPSGRWLSSLTCRSLKMVPALCCQKRTLKLHGATGGWMGVFSACGAENTRVIRRKDAPHAGLPIGVMPASDTYRVAQYHQFDDIECVLV